MLDFVHFMMLELLHSIIMLDFFLVVTGTYDQATYLRCERKLFSPPALSWPLDLLRSFRWKRGKIKNNHALFQTKNTMDSWLNKLSKNVNHSANRKNTETDAKAFSSLDSHYLVLTILLKFL